MNFINDNHIKEGKADRKLIAQSFIMNSHEI